ncbi:MAG: putative zinc-binding protein [Deltaproteobacteria bacterium]|nr:putative zinc-binding protein [Deltaproteobacteria bacterium]
MPALEYNPPDVSPRLVFACSGASDVGEIADRAARKLWCEGVGRMFCLAGIAGRVKGILKATHSASHVVVIDGCPVDCGRKTLELAGFSGFGHVRVTDLGAEKGKAPVEEGIVSRVAEQARATLHEAGGPQLGFPL